MIVFLLASAFAADPIVATGELVVSSAPPGAHVWLNGADSGLVTPTTITGLPAGDHWLKLTGACGTVERGAVVVAGAATPIDVQLPEGRGTLVIDVAPANAAVRVDEVLYTAGAGGVLLACGDHAIAVGAEGYAAKEVSWTLEPGRVDTVVVALEPVKARRRLPWAQLGLGTAAIGTGAGFTIAGSCIYKQARAAYADYLMIESDEAAEAFFDAEVAPRRLHLLADFGIGGTMLAGGTLVFATIPLGGQSSDLHVAVGPAGVSVGGAW